MHLNTILPIPGWITPEERTRYNKLKRPFLKYLRDKKVLLDPILAMHINQIITCTLYISRTEIALYPTEETGSSSPSHLLTFTPSHTNPPPLSPALLECLAKNHERINKSLKELHTAIEERAKEIGKQGPQNFLDFYAQLLKEDAELDAKEAEEAAKLAATCPPETPLSPSQISNFKSPPLSPYPSHPVNPVKNSLSPSSTPPLSDPSDLSPSPLSEISNLKSQTSLCLSDPGVAPSPSHIQTFAPSHPASPPSPLSEISNLKSQTSLCLSDTVVAPSPSHIQTFAPSHPASPPSPPSEISNLKSLPPSSSPSLCRSGSVVTPPSPPSPSHPPNPVNPVKNSPSPPPSTPKYLATDKSLADSRRRQEEEQYAEILKTPPAKTPPVLLPWGWRR